jgi:hypothetical protein
VDSELISGLMEQLKISFLEIGMLATGNLARDAGLVPFITQMGVNMRENGKTITSMVRVYLHSKMDLMKSHVKSNTQRKTLITKDLCLLFLTLKMKYLINS